MTLTFDTLVTNTPVQLMARNVDLIAAMPLIIAQAERDMPPSVDHDLFRTSASLTLGSGLNSIDLTGGHPDTSRQILELRSIRCGQGGARWMLPRRNLEAMTALYPFADARGQPLYYAVAEQELEFVVFPTPDADVNLNLMMNVLPPALATGSGNNTNIYTTHAAQLFEFRVFLRAAYYLKDQASIALYQGEVAQSTALLNAQLARRRRDETQERPIETANATGA